MRLRLLLVTLAASASAIVLPLQIVSAPFSPLAFGLFEAATTLVFAVDAFHNIRASRDRRERLWLVADVLAALPFGVLPPITPLALLRLLKLLRVWQALDGYRHRHAERWHLIRFLALSYWLTIAAHGLACVWYVLHNAAATGESRIDYLQAAYWTVQTVTTVGYGDMDFLSRGERIFAMLVMVLGVGVYATVIGAIASVLMAVDPARAHHIENMERMAVFMEHRGVPGDLRRRIRDYIAYAWEKRLGYDEATILAGLPPGLLLELSLFLKRDVLEKVPFFQGSSIELLGELALELRPLVFTPGDTIFRAGDHGDEMYFISRGRIEILGRDGSVLATLADGGFFGEIALFMKRPRTATARAIEYCDVYGLGAAAFERVLGRHPEFERHIEEMIRERQERI